MAGCSTTRPGLSLEGTWRVQQVNGYSIPSTQNIAVKFSENKIHLIGTCNPTWGTHNYSNKQFLLESIGNLGQNACTEIIVAEDGNAQEVVGRLPSVRAEEEFIKLKALPLNVEMINEQLHFASGDEKTRIILFRE